MDPERLEALRRNSGLALTKEGVWTWGTGFVENPRVQAMFHAGVAVREDGEVILSVGGMWAYIKVEVTAFFVRNVTDGIVYLCGGRELPVAALKVAGWGPDERLYLWLEGLSGPALCQRDIHQRLVDHISDDGAALTLGDRRVPLVALATIPGPNGLAPT